MLLIPDANQGHGDAQEGAFGADRAFDEIVDAELLSNFSGRLRRPFVAQGPALDDQMGRIDLRQGGAGFVGQSGGQVLALGVASQVFEGQHRERHGLGSDDVRDP